MDNRVVLGDCVEIMKGMAPDSIALTVTSPPYDNLRKYNGYSFDFENTAKQLYRITKQGGVVVWVVGDATIKGSETGTSFKQALYFKEIGFNLHDTMIYQQPGTGAKGSNLCYWQSFEYMFIFSKAIPKTVNRLKDKPNVKAGTKKHVGNNEFITGTRKERGERIVEDFGIRNNVWVIPGGNGHSEYTGHPAPFPEKLAQDHILSWSNKWDLVFDPFAGSGTTGKMAVLNDRKFIGCEISAEYTEIANQRIQKAMLDSL